MELQQLTNKELHELKRQGKLAAQKSAAVKHRFKRVAKWTLDIGHCDSCRNNRGSYMVCINSSELATHEYSGAY